jgi:predicted nucleic acid-binding protein
MTKLVLDTNILIYALDVSSAFYGPASELLRSEQNKLFITAKSISEYFAVCSKLRIEPDVVFGFYEDLKRNGTILFPNQDSLTRLEALVRTYQPKGNRVYDVEIVSIMLSYDMQVLATFNVDDFKAIREVEIFRPV